MSPDPAIAETAIRAAFSEAGLAGTCRGVVRPLAERKSCPLCRKALAAVFPEGSDAPARCGPRLRALVSRLNIRHSIPCGRIAELVRDLTGQSPPTNLRLRNREGEAQCFPDSLNQGFCDTSVNMML